MRMVSDDSKDTDPKSPEQKALELRKLTAEVEQAEIDTRKTIAEALKAELDADLAAFAIAEKMREQEDYDFSDSKFFEYMFVGEVSEESVADCLAQLAVWHRQEPACDMHIILNSPGGCVFSGMHLFDQITAYSLRGGGAHKVTITVRGMAASMAGILLQAADERVIGRESFLMIHEVSSLAYGSLGQLQDEVRICERICERIAKIFLSRGTIEQDVFAESWRRKDWWLDSDETLGYGFADRIG